MNGANRLFVAVTALGVAFFIAAAGGAEPDLGSEDGRRLAAAIDTHAAIGKARLVQGDPEGAESELAMIDRLCRLPCEAYGDLNRRIAAFRHGLASASPPAPTRP